MHKQTRSNINSKSKHAFEFKTQKGCLLFEFMLDRATVCLCRMRKERSTSFFPHYALLVMQNFPTIKITRRYYKRQTKVSFSIQNTMKFFIQYVAFFLVVVVFCCSATDCTPKIAVFSTNSAVNAPTCKGKQQ